MLNLKLGSSLGFVFLLSLIGDHVGTVTHIKDEMRLRRTPDQFLETTGVDKDLSAAIDEWRRLMNAGDYFAAHEALEHAWLTTAEPEKTFLKGLIHAAVALHHYQRGNGHGARVKFASTLRYLAPYPDVHLGAPVESLRRQLREFFGPLVALPKGSAPPPATEWPRID